MDQIKIGKFIAKQRKNKGLTQAQLADLLYVTDRAVSKWECGRSLPDSSIMLQLCEALDITVNELLTGEKIEMKDYNKTADSNLLELAKQKQESDKRLLKIEIVLMILSLLFLFACYLIAIFVATALWLQLVLFIGGGIQFLVSAGFATRIEQKAGYYECPECHHKYVPSYWRTLVSEHMGRTRKMKCPHCGKKTWQKKVIS